MLESITKPGAVTRVPENVPTRWTPFEEFSELRHRMDDLFNRGFGFTPLWKLLPSEPTVYEPYVDIYETDFAVELFVALPGFMLENIKVEASPEAIVIEGARNPIYDEKVIVRRHGGVTNSVRFCVSYAMPAEIDPAQIKATFKFGVLHLFVPKCVAARVQPVPVTIVPE